MLILRSTAKVLKSSGIVPESIEEPIEDYFSEWVVDIIPGSSRRQQILMFVNVNCHMVVLVNGKSLRKAIPSFLLRLRVILKKLHFSDNYLDDLIATMQTSVITKTNSQKMNGHLTDLKFQFGWRSDEGILSSEVDFTKAELEIINHLFKDVNNHYTSAKELLDSYLTKLYSDGKYVPQKISIITFKIWLKHMPSVWRIFRVNGNISFDDLHEIIQLVMGWENTHLYQFTYENNSFIGDTELLEQDDVADSHSIPLFEFLNTKGMEVEYLYDFGDHWEHVLKVLDIDSAYPLSSSICLDGEMNCPPEDSGGIYTYIETLKQFKRKEITYDSLFDGLIVHDPEYFNKNFVNRFLGRH